MEAAACGRALIATDALGCREIAIDGKTGLLVPLANSDALAQVMIRLAESSELRARFAKAAREEGFDEIAEWFETLARAEKSHASRFSKGLDTLNA